MKFWEWLGGTSVKSILGILFQYLGWIIAAVVSTLLVISMVRGCSSKERIAILTMERDSCWRAKEKVRTVYVTVYKEDKKVYHPKLTKHETKPLSEAQTSSNCDSVKKEFFSVNYFSDVYKTEDLKLNYGISITENKVKEVLFPSYETTRERIYITKTVDTCIAKEPLYKPRNHWMIDMNFGIHDFNNFPSTELLISYSVKNNFKFNTGGEYNFDHKEFYYKIGLGIYLSRRK